MAKYEINNIPGEINFEIGNDRVKKIVQRCKNLLCTHMGEVPFDRYRGFDPALYDLPIGQLKAKLIRELDRVMLWEPEAEVSSCSAEITVGGTVLIRVIMDINE